MMRLPGISSITSTSSFGVKLAVNLALMRADGHAARRQCRPVSLQHETAGTNRTHCEQPRAAELRGALHLAEVSGSPLARRTRSASEGTPDRHRGLWPLARLRFPSGFHGSGPDGPVTSQTGRVL